MMTKNWDKIQLGRILWLHQRLRGYVAQPVVDQSRREEHTRIACAWAPFFPLAKTHVLFYISSERLFARWRKEKRSEAVVFRD